MFAQRFNEITFELEIRPESPLLVKDGRHREESQRDRLVFHPQARRDPERPRRREGRGYGSYASPDEAFDMACVWSNTVEGPRFYLPGSSLKGVLRRGAEQIIARWRPELARTGDPFDNQAGKAVDHQRETGRGPSGAEIYAQAGPIERCFGHTALRGRWMIADAYLANEAEARVVVRDGVGIDRRSGAAAHNVKFQYEAITAGQFKTTLTLVNYELWQLGLVAHLLADLDSGTLTVGYGARRGLGRVRVGVQSVRLQWYGRHNPETAGYVIPRLSTLANTSAKAAQYQVQESTLVSVGLAEMAWKKVPATLGSAWNIIPSTSQEGVDWAAAPWPQFAATLPSVVTNWPA